MQQGDIWWFEFAAPDKARPVVILTRSGVIPYIDRVSIAPVTTRFRSIPSQVLLGMADGVNETSAVSLDNIQTVPKARLRDFVARLNVDRMCEIRSAVEFAFGFDLLD
jgi:mRNA interferase MazF